MDDYFSPPVVFTVPSRTLNASQYWWELLWSLRSHLPILRWPSSHMILLKCNHSRRDVTECRDSIQVACPGQFASKSESHPANEWFRMSNTIYSTRIYDWGTFFLKRIRKEPPPTHTVSLSPPTPYTSVLKTRHNWTLCPHLQQTK